MPTPSRGRRPTALACERLESRDLPSGLDLVAVAPADDSSLVSVRDAATGAERFRLAAFNARVQVGVAVGDVNGDGVEDIVCAAGPGTTPLVRVYSGTDGTMIREITAFDPSFRGGSSVAVGDVNNDGAADIIVGRGRGTDSGKQVKIFSGADGSLLQSYDVDTRVTAGVNVAAADANADGRADVVAAFGYGGPSTVTVFSGATGKSLQKIDAFGRFFRGGVSVAAGDVNGDGFADIVVATQFNGQLVRVFDGASNRLTRQAVIPATGFRTGLQVGTTPGADGNADVLVSNANGRAFTLDGKSLKRLDRIDLGFSRVRNFVAGAATKDADVVVDANTIALQAIRAAALPPPKASRLLAMVHGAVYDAVNAIVGGHAAYMSGLPSAPVGASAEAAAAAAAHRILSHELPAQQPLFDKFLNAALAILPNDASRNDGEGFGQTIADKMLALRAGDNSTATVSYTNGTETGQWRPTPPANAAALLPNWPSVTPFAMTSGSQFRPAGPPALTSQQYAAEYNEVRFFGAANSTVRTPDQTQIALFWADGAGTVTPPGHWNEIAQKLATSRNLSLEDSARMFALLNIAMADAAIVAWDAKFSSEGGFGRWRPITAIQNGDTDGNSGTPGDPTWTPLLATPPFPAYISGHSTFSAAAATVLTSLFGAAPFLTTSDAVPDVVRQEQSFLGAAQEAGLSRIYGGIHFQSDNVDGQTAGTALGNYVIGNFLK